jgi:cobaltochelatase CobS
MTSPAESGKTKVEDLVKVALKEAMEKRKLAETAPSGLVTSLISTVVPKTPEILSKTIRSDQKFFSDVIGNSSVKGQEDFGVTCFHSYAWDERVASFIPEADPNYVIDKDLAADILMAWELNEKVLCYGPTGAGKSILVEQLCALTRRPFVRINCTGDMDSAMIFGQLTAREGSTHWVDGAVTEAVRYGAVFAWDEWDVTPPEISMGLQWLLEDNGRLFLKEMPGATLDKQISPHEHFRLVAIGNTQGQGDETGAHAGTNVQNSATLDRFGTAVFVDYLSPAVEEAMVLKKYPKEITPKAAKELIKLANLVRQGYKVGQLNLTMSPRTILNICKKLSMGVSQAKAFEVVYLNKLSDTQRKVAKALYEKVFGTATA